MRQCSEHHIGNVIDSRVYVNAANVVCRCLQLRNCITCLQHVLLYVICRAFRSLDCFKRFCHFATAAVFACSIVSSGWIWGYCCCIMDCIHIATLLAHAWVSCHACRCTSLHCIVLPCIRIALPCLAYIDLHCIALPPPYFTLPCFALPCSVEKLHCCLPFICDTMGIACCSFAASPELLRGPQNEQFCVCIATLPVFRTLGSRGRANTLLLKDF